MSNNDIYQILSDPGFIKHFKELNLNMFDNIDSIDEIYKSFNIKNLQIKKQLLSAVVIPYKFYNPYLAFHLSKEYALLVLGKCSILVKTPWLADFCRNLQKLSFDEINQLMSFI